MPTLQDATPQQAQGPVLAVLPPAWGEGKLSAIEVRPSAVRPARAKAKARGPPDTRLVDVGRETRRKDSPLSTEHGAMAPERRGTLGAAPAGVGTRQASLILGDALHHLPQLDADSYDVVLTDPPYSSGGLFRSDRMLSTDHKYTQTGRQGKRQDFLGDNRDQRSWGYWCTLWLSECLRVTRLAGYVLMFSDWRQLPTATDALQAAGWVWRGLIVWDKTEGARAPNTGYFRHQCEYIVWGTKGTSKPADGPWPGCYRISVKQRDKHHQTGKPTKLIRELLRCCPAGGQVLDPFAGSCTTGVACLQTGRGFLGFELAPEIHAIGQRRLENAITAGAIDLHAPELFSQTQREDGRPLQPNKREADAAYVRARQRRAIAKRQCAESKVPPAGQSTVSSGCDAQEASATPSTVPSA